MKAIVKFALGPDGYGLREVPEPEPKKGEVKIKIKAVGICGSDLHTILDERRFPMPFTLGHEFVGEVVSTGGDTGNVSVGDWVTGLPACYSCGTCEFCKKGEVTLCRDRKSIGKHKNGAMAEYMVMPAKYCFKIPGDAPDRIAYAATEPLACAVRGVYERIDVKEGEVAVVSGPGTIGLFAAMAFKSRGAYVIVSGLKQDAHRLEKALEIGADAVADSFDALEAGVKKVRPHGADIVCEATGAGASLDGLLKLVKTHGTVLQAGVYGDRINIDFNQIFSKELYVTATNSTAISTWELTLDLIKQGRLTQQPVISLRLPLTEWKKGFEAALDKTAFKVLLIP